MTIEEEKDKIVEELERVPSTVVQLRKELIEEFSLSDEIKDTGSHALANGDPLAAENLRDEEFRIRGYASRAGSSGTFEFDFNSAATYSSGTNFAIPTLTTLGYIMVDEDGIVITDFSATTTDSMYFGNYCLVKDNSGADIVLVTIDDGDYSKPKSTESEEILDTLVVYSLTKTFTFTGTPLFKNKEYDGLPTIEIYLDTVKIGEIDDESNITNFGAYNYIDVNNSTISFHSKSITLTFNSLPDTFDIPLKIKYDVDNSDYDTIVEKNYDVFDISTNLFTATLLSEPIIDTMAIYLNDVKIAAMNEDGSFIGMTVTSSSYYTSPTSIGIAFSDVNNDYENSVSFEYIAKSYAIDQFETIGTLRISTFTYTDALPNTPVVIDTANILIKMNDITVATIAVDDLTNGSVTTTYSATNGSEPLVCSVQVDGTFSLVLGDGTDLAYPTATYAGDLVVEYDYIKDMDTFNLTYDEVDITSLSSVGTVTQVNIAAATIEAAPALFDFIPVVKKIDHSVYGYLKIVCEGLVENPSWNPLTTPAVDATSMNKSTFETFYGSYAPGGDDLMLSCDPSIYSYASEEESWANISDSPMYPATNGTFQPSSTSPPVIFKGEYVYTRETLNPGTPPPTFVWEAPWYVFQNRKWNYQRVPTSITVTADQTYTPVEPTDQFFIDLDVLKAWTPTADFVESGVDSDFCLNEPTGTIYVISSLTDGGHSADIAIAVQTYSVGDKVSASGWNWICTVGGLTVSGGLSAPTARGGTASDGAATFKAYAWISSATHVYTMVTNWPGYSGLPLIKDTISHTGSETCLANHVWNELVISANYRRTLTTLALIEGYRGTYSYTGTFWDTLSDFEDTDFPMTDYTTGWTYTTNFTTPFATFKSDTTAQRAASVTRLAAIQTSIGTVTTSGYAKNIYDTCNLALELDIGYVKKTIKKHYDLDSFYDNIATLRAKYNAYNSL